MPHVYEVHLSNFFHVFTLDNPTQSFQTNCFLSFYCSCWVFFLVRKEGDMDSGTQEGDLSRPCRCVLERVSLCPLTCATFLTHSPSALFCSHSAYEWKWAAFGWHQSQDKRLLSSPVTPRITSIKMSVCLHFKGQGIFVKNFISFVCPVI